MHNAELESQLASSAVPDSQQNSLIRELDEGLVLRNTSQAREIINKLMKLNKKQAKQIRMLNQTMEVHDREIIINRENVENEKKKAKVNEELRYYYQQLLIKFVRDVDMLKDAENIAKFEKVNEFSIEVLD